MANLELNNANSPLNPAGAKIFGVDANGCRIEISANGSNGWTALVSGQSAAGAPLQLSAYLTARYWRVVMVNGVTAQSSLSITSGQFRA